MNIETTEYGTNGLRLCRHCGGEAKESLLVCFCTKCWAQTKNFTGCGGEYQREKQMARNAWNNGEYGDPVRAVDCAAMREKSDG